MRFIIPLLGACTGAPGNGDSGDSAPWDRGPNPHALDDVLRFNHIQVKGTHNSYHLEPETVFDESHRYTHPTLTEQLDLWGVRQFELDLHRTEDTDQWHVFHLPGVDEETSCLRFTDCLAEIKAWSDDHGWHLPITIWIEPKDEIDGLAADYREIEPEDLFALDTDIRSVFPEDRLFAPDDLRRGYDTLPAALAAEGWPLLGDMRGQVLFAMLDTGDDREAYSAETPALEGRAMFVDTSTETDAYAALVKDGSPEDITRWVQAGFIITDNGSRAADDDTAAEASDRAILDAGVHHAATDLPAPVDGRSYWLDLAPRCNPVSAPSECDDGEVEKLD